jgi:hypothetical protein
MDSDNESFFCGAWRASLVKLEVGSPSVESK